MSQWRQEGDVARFGGDFEHIFFINEFDTMLFNHVIIMIVHGWEGSSYATTLPVNITVLDGTVPVLLYGRNWYCSDTVFPVHGIGKVPNGTV